MFAKMMKKPFSHRIYRAVAPLCLSLLVTGCGRFEISARVEPLQEAAVISPTPVGAQATVTPITAATQPELPTIVVPLEEPTIAPVTAIPTTTPAAAQALPNPAGAAPLLLDATYRDTIVGLALEYPGDWTIIELTDEQKAQAVGYSTTFHSWPAGPGGGGGIPDGGTKIDLAVNRTGAMSLADASAQFRQQFQAPDKVLAEEPIVLASGLQGLRFRTSSIFGEAEQALFLVNGYMVIFGGLGDEVVIQQILQTLRVLG